MSGRLQPRARRRVSISSLDQLVGHSPAGPSSSIDPINSLFDRASVFQPPPKSPPQLPPPAIDNVWPSADRLLYGGEVAKRQLLPFDKPHAKTPPPADVDAVSDMLNALHSLQFGIGHVLQRFETVQQQEAERLRLEAEEHERVTGEKMMARALIAMQKCEIKRGFNAFVDMYDKKAWAYSTLTRGVSYILHGAMWGGWLRWENFVYRKNLEIIGLAYREQTMLARGWEGWLEAIVGVRRAVYYGRKAAHTMLNSHVVIGFRTWLSYSCERLIAKQATMDAIIAILAGELRVMFKRWVWWGTPEGIAEQKQQLKTRSVIAFLKRHVNNAYLCWKYKAMARGKRQSLLIRLLHLTQRRNLRRTYLNWIKTWAKSATAQALLVRAVTRRFSKGAGGAFRFWKHQSKSRRGLGKSSLLSPLRATGLSRRALSLRSKKASQGKEASPRPSPRSGGSGKGASSSSTKAAPPPSPASLAANLAAARAQRLLDQAEGNRTPRKEQEKALMDDLAEESESSVVEARLVYAGYGPAFTRDSGDPYNGAPSA